MAVRGIMLWSRGKANFRASMQVMSIVFRNVVGVGLESEL